MNELRKLLGIREHEKAAPREKSKTVDVESRHNNLKKILTNGFMKGDVKSPKDLQTYCQKAKMRHDFGEANDVSPFECATGQMPSPGRNLAMMPPEKTKERVRSMHMERGVCRKEEEGNRDNRVHRRSAGIPWMRAEHRTDDEAEDRESEKSRSDDEIDQNDNARRSDSSTEGDDAMFQERRGLKQEGDRKGTRRTEEKASSGNLISRNEEMTAVGEEVVPAGGSKGDNAMLQERRGLKQEGDRNETRQTEEKASSGNLISRDEEMTAVGEESCTCAQRRDKYNARAGTLSSNEGKQVFNQ